MLDAGLEFLLYFFAEPSVDFLGMGLGQDLDVQLNLRLIFRLCGVSEGASLRLCGAKGTNTEVIVSFLQLCSGPTEAFSRSFRLVDGV